MCGWTGCRFEPFGSVATYRRDAQCPLCGSLERHRLAFLLLRDRISRGQRALHVAPEPTITLWLIPVPSEYLNIDLYAPAMRRMDLANLEFNSSKTLAWCSHAFSTLPMNAKHCAKFIAPWSQAVCSCYKFLSKANRPVIVPMRKALAIVRPTSCTKIACVSMASIRFEETH